MLNKAQFYLFPVVLIIIIYFKRRLWHPIPVLLPGKSHGRRSLVGCSSWGREELETTEQLHFSLSCIGEGNGNPLQCSCLENPRDWEPGGLPSMGSHRVRHNWSDLAAAAAAEEETFKLCVSPFCRPPAQLKSLLWALAKYKHSECIVSFHLH